jgi:hypothetical protein
LSSFVDREGFGDAPASSLVVFERLIVGDSSVFSLGFSSFFEVELDL